MAKSAKAKKRNEEKQKLKTLKGYIVSVKLFSNLRRGDQAYEQLIESLFKDRIIGDIHGETQMMMRTQFKRAINNYSYYYGFLGKFTRIEGDDWLDVTSGQKDKVEIPRNKFPNLRDVEYVFVPHAHRFFFKRNQQVSLSAVVKYLRSAVKKTISVEEQLDVNVDLSSDIIDQIINADIIENLLIDISYSNDDTNVATADFMDQQMKKAGISNAKMKFTPDAKGNINIDGTFIQGALELSRTNGNATAKIVGEDGKSTTIKTEEHPQLHVVKDASMDAPQEKIAEEILNKFREND